MAEIATIARPYAEALFRAGGGSGIAAEMSALGAVAADVRLRQFADNPKVSAEQVHGVVTDVLNGQGVVLSAPVQNLLRAVLDNGRLAALPEVAAQFNALVNAQSGISEALIESAFPIEAGLLPEVVNALEKRYARRLNASVAVKPELIGGIRVTVGDEVLDTSVKARLEQMKAALVA